MISCKLNWKVGVPTKNNRIYNQYHFKQMINEIVKRILDNEMYVYAINAQDTCVRGIYSNIEHICGKVISMTLHQDELSFGIEPTGAMASVMELPGIKVTSCIIASVMKDEDGGPSIVCDDSTFQTLTVVCENNSFEYSLKNVDENVQLNYLKSDDPSAQEVEDSCVQST